MKEVQELPRNVREIEHTWIPMRDGTHLSAKIWLPEDADDDPVPAILEYIPYRKRDIKRPRDARMHPYFAGHGYASVRVDIRGSGDSEGVLEDEYLPQELEDGEDVLRWLENQSWCNGNVGMIGISWGGFNGLQLAARQPPQLKSVISVCASDDRYSDDVHYMGGCLLNDNLSWASTMFAYNSLPPDPKIVGGQWRDMWMNRLEGSGLWVEKWTRRLHRTYYWKHGSICENYNDVQIPVMAVSGWADGYTNPVFRLMKNLSVPRKGLIGPWSHIYPHAATPGPQIGFLQEALRWWDKWLKGIETGIMEEPMLMIFMQDSVRPKTEYLQRPGRWVAENSWPSPNVKQEKFQLGQGKLFKGMPNGVDQDPLTIQSPLSVGLFGGKWCSFSGAPDLPYDQREEDGGSLVFDTEPLEEPIEILGSPELELELSSDKPVAMIAVRLSEIAPDDKATRVTFGLLNLCHRDSHESPKPLRPGEKEKVSIPLNYIAQNFPKGHRLRVAISTSYWPLAWAPPEPVRLTIYPENSAFYLPVRNQETQEDNQISTFEKSETAPGLSISTIKGDNHNWHIYRDLARDESTLYVINDDGRYRLNDINLDIEKCTEEWYTYRGDDFESVQGEVATHRSLNRKNWNVSTRTYTLLTCNSKEFIIHATLDAYEGKRRVFSKIWDERIKRDLV